MTISLPVPLQEQKVFELVKAGETLNVARRIVYANNIPTTMPYFLPGLFKHYLAQGHSRAVATRMCGVSEGQIYRWAKTSARLKKILTESAQFRKESIISMAVKRARSL